MKKLLSVILCGLIAGGALMSLTACGTGGYPEYTGPDLPNTDIPAYKGDTEDTPDITSSQAVTHKIFDDDIQTRINNHITDFSVQMFKQSVASQKEENTLVSPISVYTLLSLLANGADFTTKTEITDILSGYYQFENGVVCYAYYDPLTVDELNEYFDSYMTNLNNTDKSKLSMANSVWVNNDTDVKFNADFLTVGQERYHSELFERRFDDKTLKELNRWVDKKTDGMIDNILDEIPSKSIMFLVNALAFDSKWENPYEKTQIIDGMEFNNYDGSRTETQFLSSVEGDYITSEKACGFIKYYEDYDYSFVALLPDEDISIDEYIDNVFNLETINEAINTSSSSDVYAYIPKFETGTTLDLEKILGSLGIRLAFDKYEADFSKLASVKNPESNIYIGQAIHKTYIKLDENGTKASAATLFSVEKNDAAPITEEHTVKLDRPFVYAIYDNNAQIPVFIGTVKNL